MSLAGKKILITGATSGIGQAVAIAVSRLGGRVVLNGRNEERMRNTLSLMSGEGHIMMPYDLTDLQGIKQYVQDCVQADGVRFDGLVYSTGIGRSMPMRSENLADYQKLMQTNCDSFFALLMAFSSKRVLNNGGSIVALSSSATIHLDKSQGAYAASKAAIEAMCGVAANEFSSRKVRVNAVCPEMTRTPMTAGFFGITTEAVRRQLYPLGDLTPEEVADTIVFLLSDMSRKITGQSIYLSAGNDGRPIEGTL